MKLYWLNKLYLVIFMYISTCVFNSSQLRKRGDEIEGEQGGECGMV